MYYAFISYKREDSQYAKWLQRKLHGYRLPAKLKSQAESGRISLNGRDVPSRLAPVFRDQTDLIPGVLSESLTNALQKSRYLIVICSKHAAAKSTYLDMEIKAFLESGHTPDQIIPLIVDTESKAPEKDCFPLELKALNEKYELLGANFKDSGKNDAFLKIVANMLGVQMAEVKNLAKIIKIKQILAFSAALLLAASCFCAVIGSSETKINKRDITIKANEILSDIEHENMLSALEKLADLKEEYGWEKEQKLIEEIVGNQYLTANYIGALNRVEAVKTASQGLAFVPKSNHVICWSVPENGKISVEIYNSLLKLYRQTELDCPEVEKVHALSNALKLDYNHENGEISVSLGNSLFVYGQNSELLRQEEIAPTEERPYTKALRKESWVGPVVEINDAAYFLASFNSSINFDYFSECLLVKRNYLTDEFEILATVAAPAMAFNYEELYITPDEKYAIIMEQRGIYASNIRVIETQSGKEIFKISDISGSIKLDFSNYQSGKMVFYPYSSTDEAVMGIFDIGAETANNQYLEFSYGSYETTPKYAIGNSGMIYLLDTDKSAQQLLAITTENISLVDLLCGTESENISQISLNLADNLLIANPERFSTNSVTEHSCEFGEFMAKCAIISKPANGTQVALELWQENKMLFRLTSGENRHPYFDGYGNFGFVDYQNQCAAKSFRLYSYQELVEKLEIAGD